MNCVGRWDWSGTPTSTEPSGDATEGTGPSAVDAGYLTLNVPAGVKWEVADSPANGFAVSRVVLNGMPSQGILNVSSTSMAHSYDAAGKECERAFTAAKKQFKAAGEKTYGTYKYHVFVTDGDYDKSVYLCTWDAETDLFVQHQGKRATTGDGFADATNAEAVLNSVKYKKATPRS